MLWNFVDFMGVFVILKDINESIEEWNLLRGILMFFKKVQKTYDRENQCPVLRCSICTGEQVAGFKDIHTGKFEEIMLIRNEQDLDNFMRMYDINSITKEY